MDRLTRLYRDWSGCAPDVQIVQFRITSEAFFGKIRTANNTVSDTITTENVAFCMEESFHLRILPVDTDVDP